MLQGKNETDSPERTRRVGLLAMLAGAGALAVLLVGLMAGSRSVQAQEAAATYTGPVEVVAAAQCGGGTISITVNAGGTAITQLALDGTYVVVLVNNLSDPVGLPYVIALDPAIAIASDGSFSATFVDPSTTTNVDIAGHFSGETVSGTFSAAALGCVDVPFSADVGAAAATPTATVVAAVPEAGSGGYLDQRSSGLPMVACLMLASGALGVLCLGVGLRWRAKRA